MEARWSRSKISKLGKALIATVPPPVEPLNDLHELLMMYDEALDVAVAKVQVSMHVQLTSRLKNTGTILEKLRRSGGGSLPNVQDLAGIRIVLDCDLREQLRFAKRVASLFADEARPPKVVDRRFEALRGYRAVHVVASVDGRLVEIQIRTRLQHQWANLFEKLADIVGRGIRYGEPPDLWTVLVDIEFEKVVRAGESLAGEQSALSLIVDRFDMLSEVILACEVAEAFHDNTELFEVDLQEDVPILETVEKLKEAVQEAARSIEQLFAAIINFKELRAVEFATVKAEVFGSDSSEGVEVDQLDREVLRAELRKRALGLDDGSSPPGDDVVRTDSDSGEG
jgi:ppGpp synthetase/RelA/SpoT-type nucleotidyltranferase